ITVADLGMREGAALALLSLYGVTNADAVAASLLTLSAALFWAVLGGLLFWSESVRQLQRRPTPRTISVVIPTLNEATALAETVRRARAIPEISEIIVVDGGSNDATRQIAAQLGCRVLVGSPGRGGQMQRGAAQAT